MLGLFAPKFRFVEPGPLRDQDLELVAPSHQHAEAFLRAVSHPQCAADPECHVSATALHVYLDSVPNGQEPPRPRRGKPATYQFWMRQWPRAGDRHPAPNPRFVGTVSLRVGNDENLRRYFGHIGYLVFPPARGQHLAERAVRLLLPLARHHGLDPLWITTNPDNLASRRTCERLGCRYVETVDLPVGHSLWRRGERQKCRYRLDLGDPLPGRSHGGQTGVQQG